MSRDKQAVADPRRVYPRLKAFDIYKTLNLYDNSLISMLCLAQNFARQGVAVFASTMRAFILVLLLCPAGVFAAGNEQPELPAKAVAGYDSYRGEQVARAAEISAIEKSGRPGKTAALKRLLSHKDPLVRGEAALAMGRSGESAAFVELSSAVKSGDDHTRWGAMEGLRALGDKRASPAVIKLLSHPDKVTRWKAAEALGDFGGAGAADALVKTAGDEKEYIYVRLAAVESLVRIGDKKAAPALRGLENSKDGVFGEFAGKAAAILEKGK